MNTFTVTAPAAGFAGESCGVAFSNGAGRVNDSTKEGRAAIEYFRRRGYTLTPEGAADAPTEEPLTPDGPFDPSKHDVGEVIAYLDSLGTDDSDAVAEFDRIIAAEHDGKARKTILARGEQQTKESDPS